jgi:hypothetical protein
MSACCRSLFEGAESAGAEQAQQRRLDRTRQETAVHAMAGNPRQLVEARQTGIDRAGLAKSLGQQVLDKLGSCCGRGTFLRRHDTSLVVQGDLCNGGFALQQVERT